MHDNAKVHRIHGEVNFHNVGANGKNAICKDYGFKCTYITGSTKFPNYNFLYEYIGV